MVVDDDGADGIGTLSGLRHPVTSRARRHGLPLVAVADRPRGGTAAPCRLAALKVACNQTLSDHARACKRGRAALVSALACRSGLPAASAGPERGGPAV